MLFAEEVARLISKATKKNTAEILGLLEVPPDSKLGDIAFPCFTLAKNLKKHQISLQQTLPQLSNQKHP